MTGYITVADEGQDYIFFHVLEGHINDEPVCLILHVWPLMPEKKMGWECTQILNRHPKVGDKLTIKLHTGHIVTLPPPITRVHYRYRQQFMMYHSVAACKDFQFILPHRPAYAPEEE